MTSFTKIILLPALLCLSCSKTQTHDFDFNNSEFVKLNDAQLTDKQIRKLESALNKLEGDTEEIYSKPSDQITFTTDGKASYLSIFADEKFVFEGFYLDAWTARMEGRESAGFKLSSDLSDLINELKSETGQSPSR